MGAKRGAPLVTGVRNPVRLRATAEARLHGHMGDPELDAVVATLQLASGCATAVVNVVRPDEQVYPAERGVGAACSHVRDEVSFCAEVVETGRPLTVADATAHPVYARNPLVVSGAVGAYAGVPLVDDGVVLGAVSVLDRSARSFSPQVLQILEHQARLAGAVLALRRLARTDVLTGLPNRRVLLDRLGEALARTARQGGSTCVMYLDLDGFKGVNDVHGHDGGDAVLVEVGVRVGRVLRPFDTLARFGGDEFVVLCEALSDDDAAERTAARVVEALTGPWQVHGSTVEVGVSVGVAVTSDPHVEPAALLREADEALYAAKQAGGGRWVRARRVVDLREPRRARER